MVSVVLGSTRNLQKVFFVWMSFHSLIDGCSFVSRVQKLVFNSALRLNLLGMRLCGVLRRLVDKPKEILIISSIPYVN